MKASKVSEAVIRRLPRYYRHLEMLKAKNVERISSSELARQMRLNPSQVRQDLNCFGGFGQQGYGYPVQTLFHEIASILGLTEVHRIVIAGAGNIGQALCKYEGFSSKGFQIMALFDVDPNVIGKNFEGAPVLPVEQMPDYIREHKIDIGIITARRRVAQELADQMVEAGIRAIWNFVPTDMHVPVPLENIHLSDSMMVLSYRLTNSAKSNNKEENDGR